MLSKPFIEGLSTLRSHVRSDIDNEHIHNLIVLVLAVQMCSIKLTVQLHDVAVETNIQFQTCSHLCLQCKMAKLKRLLHFISHG